MALHWTYCTFEPDSDLQQGDILSRTDELLTVLKNVHSYFCDERYLAFIVVTQSCDLVRRKKEHVKPDISHWQLFVNLTVCYQFISEVCAFKNTKVLVRN